MHTTILLAESLRGNKPKNKADDELDDIKDCITDNASRFEQDNGRNMAEAKWRESLESFYQTINS